jgi:hypothetical protein
MHLAPHSNGFMIVCFLLLLANFLIGSVFVMLKFFSFYDPFLPNLHVHKERTNVAMIGSDPVTSQHACLFDVTYQHANTRTPSFE